MEICVKGIDNGSEAILIHLFGISSEVLFSFKFWKSLQTYVASTGDMKKLETGDLQAPLCNDQWCSQGLDMQ